MLSVKKDTRDTLCYSSLIVRVNIFDYLVVLLHVLTDSPRFGPM